MEVPSDNIFATGMPTGLTNEDVSRLFSNYGSVASVRITSKPEHNFTSALVRFATQAEAKYVVENLNGNLAPGLTNPLQVRYANAPGKGGGKGGCGGPSPGDLGLNMVGIGSFGGDGFGSGGVGGDSRYDPYGLGALLGGKGMGKGGKGMNDAESMCLALEGSGHLPGAGIPKNQVIEVFVFGLPPDTTDAHLYRLFSTFGQISPKGCSVNFAKDTGLCKGFGFVNFLSNESAQLAIESLNGFQFAPGKSLRVELKSEGKRAGGAAGGGGGKGGAGGYSAEAMALGLM
eukprot:TRINITY_DN900_c0_g1_i14.p1 TRINITY_DN900_c0_g1~~TRINITY_DN900_c0_g1_i14.p1  ORF type:complete len:288 (+),score=54.56 TRINITY_DN900_c0_g1_i14:133-996(+)